MKEIHERHGEILARLEALGDVRFDFPTRSDPVEGRWVYLDKLGFGASDVEALTTIAEAWAYRSDWPEDQDDTTVYAPIHAWRALARLGEAASAAVPRLIATIPVLNERDDDWHGEEYPTVLAMIGEAAYEPAANLALDPDEELFIRWLGLNTITCFSNLAPHRTDRCIKLVMEVLSDYERNDPEVNAACVDSLMTMDNEHRSAELVEHAFAANCIDEQHVGGWGEVRREWGVAGLGIASDHRREEWWDRKGFQVSTDIYRQLRKKPPKKPPEERQAAREHNRQRQQAKAKTKRRQARKQNRKKR